MNDTPNMTDDNNLKELTRLRHAVRALSDSASKALMMETSEGVGAMLARNYTRLHQRATELLPEDYFIETFTLEIDDDLPDAQKVAQVQLMADQMAGYVKNLIREERTASSDIEDLRSIGTELRDQVVRMTKTTLKRAISNMEWSEYDDTTEGDNTAPRNRTVKVRVNLDDDTITPSDTDRDTTPPRTI
ncbi:MAG: hypothetical protein ACLFTK_01685 [Anaerolineales bacterium]